VKVLIKSFDVDMSVKTNGIELEVRTPDGNSQIGDCYATMTGLIWCEGKTQRKNGIKLSWEQLKTICYSQDSLKTAISAAKKLNTEKISK
jgi:hypothetical protein